MTKKGIWILFSFCWLTSGCVFTSEPSGSTDFDELKALNQLEGRYQNIGEAEAKSTEFYLSNVIWPTAQDVDHKAIEFIEVQKILGNSLLVKAFSKDNVVKESKFVEKVDFEIIDGRIRLKQEMRVAGFKRGDPIVGPYYESVELGVDQSGAGKFRRRSATAALIFLAIPVAGVGTTDVRFPKIKQKLEFK